MKARVLLCAAIACLFVALPFPVARAQSVDEIQHEIDLNTAQIEKLNKEIEQYQQQLDATTKQKNTLQNKITQLDLQRKKLAASIAATKSRISTTQLQIKQLEKGISTKQNSIEDGQASLAQGLRLLNEREREPLSMAILSAENLSDAWEDSDSLAVIEEAIGKTIVRLAVEKQTLSETKTRAEEKRAELQRQQAALITQEGSLNATRRAQSDLLAETKSQESAYQALLAQKQAAKASFESALTDLKAKLQYTVDLSAIAPAGRGTLRWPLDSIRITQYFGNTSFARSGAYSGKGHNGIDIAAQIGTPVKAAISGIVKGTGDTGLVRGCYSYGRWILIKHANGLDTLYAHLSQVNVVPGQSVPTGQVIGYSGQTGYATGPHLHFGVYVSEATQIMKLKEATNKKTACSEAILPISPLTGYLDPMSYL